MTKVDVVIRNGEIVTAGGSMGCADIGIRNGVIVQIGGELEGQQDYDVENKLVLPGGVDAHVHLSIPGEGDRTLSWVDDFASGSAAALAGGITTLGNMTFPLPGETPIEALKRDASIAKKQTIVDLFFHPVIDKVTPEVLADVPDLLDAGCNSIKFFTVSPWFDSHMRGYLEATRLAGENGLITMIHCEDYSIIEDATDRLVRDGKTTLRYYPESRPVISEVVATQKAVAFAEITGSPIYIVHVSSKRSLGVCVEAQNHNLPIFVETRPLYLHLTGERFEDVDGAKYVGQPPLREQQDVEALWIGLSQGVVHTVCTDHAPWSLAAKLDPAHTITNVRPGVANLQTMLPMLYSEGVRSKRITLGRFVELTSTNAAKLFGLFPKKGTIAVGSDADLVIFDPNLALTVDNSMLKSNADYSPYEGYMVTGWPVLTFRRGEIVFRDGNVIGQPGTGVLVSRGETTPI